MNARGAVVSLLRIALAALAVALIASYVANTYGYRMTQAQISPIPTSTFTPTPADTPVPPTPTNTPVPPTSTNTPVPPTDTPVPLVCSGAVPSIATLWPPNHGFVAISVLGVRGGDGGSIAITIDGIAQDEPVHIPGSGSTSPDGWGAGTATAHVRAERDGGGNGRVYHIAFTVDDGHGGTCSGDVLVSAPQSVTQAAVNDGALYDSTVVIPWP